MTIMARVTKRLPAVPAIHIHAIGWGNPTSYPALLQTYATTSNPTGGLLTSEIHKSLTHMCEIMDGERERKKERRKKRKKKCIEQTNKQTNQKEKTQEIGDLGGKQKQMRTDRKATNTSMQRVCFGQLYWQCFYQHLERSGGLVGLYEPALSNGLTKGKQLQYLQQSHFPCR